MMKSQLQGRRPSSASNREAELSAQLAEVSLSTALPPLENRAAQSASPYVRSHGSSPVAWQLLDDDAVQRAKKENKLIFIHIGFKSCYTCRLMSTESFTHPEIAKLLNSSFIPIIVDRDERPDIDNIYMGYITASTASGGWPLNIFCTPELEPVFGGTYWCSPGTEMIGLDGEEVPEDERRDFLYMLHTMKAVWPEQEARCRQEAKVAVSKVRDYAGEGTLCPPGIGTPGVANAACAAAAPTETTGPPTAVDSDLDLDQLEEAYAHIVRAFDPINGGFSVPPKFFTPTRLSFLLRLPHLPSVVADIVGEKEVEHASLMALHTLRKVRDGGVRDHVGGGFHRFAVTADWSLPQFEKMVSDNALLLGVYLDAWLSTAASTGKIEKEDEFANMVLELAEYLTSPPILRADGGFASSEAADSNYRKGHAQMRQGAYYVWTRREFDQAVGESDSQVSAVAAAHWNVLSNGNVDRKHDRHDDFINQNVLCTVKDAKELGKQFGISPAEARKLIETARHQLKAHREKTRVRPETDDKAVTSTNAMVISALARTSSAIKSLDAAKAGSYLKAATGAATFIKEKLWDEQSKTLYRFFSDQRSQTQAFAEDYAFLIEALVDLYESTGEEGWLQWADDLQKRQIDLFYDPTIPSTSQPITPTAHHSACGGFYSTSDETSHVVIRLKDGMDITQPSANGVSASNLFRLGFILGDSTYTTRARETINAFEVEALHCPWLFAGLLGSVVTARLGGIVWSIKPVHDGSKEDELRKKFYELPRAGLRSLVFLKEGGWLTSTRNKALGSLGEGTYQFDGTYKPFKEEDY